MAATAKRPASASPPLQPVTWHTRLQSAILFAMLLTAPVLPRMNAVFLALLAILAIADLFARRPAVAAADRLLAGATILVSSYLFLNALWARDPGAALGKAALVALVAGAIYVVGASVLRQTGAAQSTAAKAIAWGALAGAGLALFEFTTNHTLRLSLLELWPAIRSESNAVQIFIREGSELVPVPPSEYGRSHANEVVQIYSDGLNRNLSLLLLYLWPVLAVMSGEGRAGVRRGMMATLLVMAAVTVFISASQTAQIALLGGATIFLLARFSARFVHWGLVSAWCVALILTLPLASVPYKAGLHEAEWLFPSARDRIAIWSLTAELAEKNAVLGVGIRSTRIIGREMRESPEHAATYGKPRRLGIHAHNHFLQIWFELGGIGAALILAWGLLLLSRIRALDSCLKPFGYATFATAALIASFGWGLWQSWLLVGFGATIVLFQFSRKIAGPAS